MPSLRRRRTAAEAGSTASEHDAARTRKQFARRQWRRRWLAWRYLVAAFAVLPTGASATSNALSSKAGGPTTAGLFDRP